MQYGEMEILNCAELVGSRVEVTRGRQGMGQHQNLDLSCPSFHILRIFDYTTDAIKQRNQNYELALTGSCMVELGHDQRLRFDRKYFARQCGVNSIYHRYDGSCGGLPN